MGGFHFYQSNILIQYLLGTFYNAVVKNAIFWETTFGLCT